MVVSSVVYWLYIPCLLSSVGGLGRLRPNTVCFGYKKDWKTCSNESASLYESMVASSLANGRGVIIVRDPQKTFQLPGLIDENNTNTEEINAKNDEGEEQSLVVTNAGSKSPSNGGIQVASVRSMSTANRIGKTMMGTQKKEKRRIDVYWLADVSVLLLLSFVVGCCLFAKSLLFECFLTILLIFQ